LGKKEKIVGQVAPSFTRKSQKDPTKRKKQDPPPSSPPPNKTSKEESDLKGVTSKSRALDLVAVPYHG